MISNKWRRLGDLNKPSKFRIAEARKGLFQLQSGSLLT